MRVCILGSGLSALTLAKALVNENISVDITFTDKVYKINQSRTLGVSKSNFDYFNRNIINIEKISWKLKKIDIFNENLKNEKLLNFQNNNDQLFSIIKNSQLYDLLEKSLSKNKLFKKIKLKKNSKNFFKYNIIINTDYTNYLTKKYFNKKIEKIYKSWAYTTLIKHEKILNDTAIQIFTKNGPLAFLPMSETLTSIVYSIHNSKDIKKFNIKDLIYKYNSKYKIKKIENIESFELKSFTLRSYYYQNILAFGDLLHRLHPLAGQGYNMTIRDIKLLLDIIKEKIDLGLPLDSSINQKFEKKIRHKNYIFSNGIDFIHEFFNLDRKLNNRILSKSVQILGKNSYLNKFFTKIADSGINY
ncbi:FAD-dependent monooxygenase [Candidatus Pelagibacter sp.]|nr:FAD-dependent monooxygenase [Candidatus Pelagibacter sp.]